MNPQQLRPPQNSNIVLSAMNPHQFATTSKFGYFASCSPFATPSAPSPKFDSLYSRHLTIPAHLPLQNLSPFPISTILVATMCSTLSTCCHLLQCWPRFPQKHPAEPLAPPQLIQTENSHSSQFAPCCLPMSTPWFSTCTGLRHPFKSTPIAALRTYNHLCRT